MHLFRILIWIVAGRSGARYLKDKEEDSVHQDLDEINIEGKLSLGESKIDKMKANDLQMKSVMMEIKSDMMEMKDNDKVMESRIASMEDDVKEMKSNMKEMRDLLVQLVGREKKEQ